MRVTVHDHVRIVSREQALRCRGAHLVAVTHVHAQAVDLEVQERHQPWRAWPIRVPQHGTYRSNRLKLLEDPVADVARMEDQLNTVEGRKYFRSHHSVRI